MEWVKLVAIPAYYMDGALLRAGEAAEVLFCRALAHCGLTESAGVVDKAVLPTIVQVKAQQRADALVREGLWVDEGTSYRIRSWDKWQDEHDLAAERRAQAKERKRRERDRKRDVTRDTSVTVTATGAGQTREVTPLDRDRDVEGEGQPTTSVVAPGKPSPRGTRIPDEFPPDKDTAARLAAWAAEHAPAVPIKAETDNWQDWHRAKGDTAKDWVASWRTWMRRAQADAERRPQQLSLARPSGARPSATDQRVAQTLQLAAELRAQETA